MQTDKGKQLLENAYQLETPDDNVAYYDQFSDTYDSDFADALGFALPAAVAAQYLARANGAAPIADLGCGTGLVGEALRDASPVIDGLDISPKMLDAAAQRGVYRNLIELDLTKDIGHLTENYAAVLSSGTFTHGHLGPEALDNALKIGAAECLFVLSINKAHYTSKGFARALDAYRTSGKIRDLRSEEVPIYTRTDHDHAGDRALIVSFVKT